MPVLKDEDSSQQQVLRHVNVGILSKNLQRGQQLPEAYRWIHEEQEALNEEEQLPVIDLQHLVDSMQEWCPDGEQQNQAGVLMMMNKVSKQVRAACEEWGAFQVVNHGVPETVVDETRNRGLELFALPEAQKLNAERPPGDLFGYGATRMASFFNRLMWSEAFTMKGSPDSNIRDYAQRLCIEREDEFCKPFQEYDQAMRRLAMLIIKILLQDLGATANQIEDTKSFCGMIHMNYYPPCPNPSEAIGLASHTDSSCLTIMHQGNVGGLQVKRGDKWFPVKPVSGAFVVQVGDMLQVMSNNAFKSVVHRAVVNDSFTRLSLVYFFSPPPFASISPIHSSRALYRCLTWNEYLQAKTKLFMGALDHFLLPLHH